MIFCSNATWLLSAGLPTLKCATSTKVHLDNTSIRHLTSTVLSRRQIGRELGDDELVTALEVDYTHLREGEE